MTDGLAATAAATWGSRGRVDGSLTDLDGERFYRIGTYDLMDPFLMSIVSDSDHWMFLSSTGALTAGRRDPDNALFPYYTDDRIHNAWCANRRSATSPTAQRPSR